MNVNTKNLIENETEWLLYYLWKKEPDTENIKFNFYIPPTVIYKGGISAIIWYFTSQKERVILRKNKRKITPKSIYEEFAKKNEKTDIAAHSFSFQEIENKIRVSVCHYSIQDLKDFIILKEKGKIDIFQKFVRPKDGRNAMIKVDWAPKLCLINKRTNINEINNTKIDFNERLVTYDGPEHLSKEEKVLSQVHIDKITLACSDISKQIAISSQNTITILNMTLYFKFDVNEHLALVCCSNMKIANLDPSPGFFQRHVDKINREIIFILNDKERMKIDPKYKMYEIEEEIIGAKSSNRKQLRLNMFSQNICTFCEITIGGNTELLEASHKTIIEMHDFCNHNLLSMQDFANLFDKGAMIPKPLKFLYPGMNEKDYLEKKQQPMWVYTLSGVCDECHQTLIDFTETNRDERGDGLRTKCRGLLQGKNVHKGLEGYGRNNKSFHSFTRGREVSPGSLERTYSSIPPMSSQGAPTRSGSKSRMEGGVKAHKLAVGSSRKSPKRPETVGSRGNRTSTNKNSVENITYKRIGSRNISLGSNMSMQGPNASYMKSRSTTAKSLQHDQCSQIKPIAPNPTKGRLPHTSEGGCIGDILEGLRKRGQVERPEAKYRVFSKQSQCEYRMIPQFLYLGGKQNNPSPPLSPGGGHTTDIEIKQPKEPKEVKGPKEVKEVKEGDMGLGLSGEEIIIRPGSPGAYEYASQHKGRPQTADVYARGNPHPPASDEGADLYMGRRSIQTETKLPTKSPTKSQPRIAHPEFTPTVKDIHIRTQTPETPYSPYNTKQEIPKSRNIGFPKRSYSAYEQVLSVKSEKSEKYKNVKYRGNKGRGVVAPRLKDQPATQIKVVRLLYSPRSERLIRQKQREQNKGNLLQLEGNQKGGGGDSIINTNIYDHQVHMGKERKRRPMSSEHQGRRKIYSESNYISSLRSAHCREPNIQPYNYISSGSSSEIGNSSRRLISPSPYIPTSKLSSASSNNVTPKFIETKDSRGLLSIGGPSPYYKQLIADATRRKIIRDNKIAIRHNAITALNPKTTTHIQYLKNGILKPDHLSKEEKKAIAQNADLLIGVIKKIKTEVVQV